MADPLTQKIKAQARRLGFSLVGVTSPDPPPHLAVFEDWLDREHHGHMAYLASENHRRLRADPRLILPECKSILVLGIRYPNPLSAASDADEEPGGSVAAYAWGKDYHLILPARMDQLIRFIEKRSGRSIPSRRFTDTGPLLERDLAQQAGLGWIGKNTCLVSPGRGSYFFLAEILLGVELEADRPFGVDLCGKCTRCIQACPTGCILPDRTLDARRCIAYLTIELRGSIPREQCERIGNWIFGCDVCQMVCPWNRFAGDKYEPAFAPMENLPRPHLADEITLSPEAFNRKFAESAIKRARRSGYLRNILVALGNTHRQELIPLLQSALEDPDPLVRKHAQWAAEEMSQ